jgi:Bacterial alpha-L-rhamnosidase C-terminal domain/Bacterial alpha-L-rhamnosidase 6 hairpin glycosidase domain
VATAREMVSDPVNLLEGCDVPAGEKVILDGVARDRCEFTGDIAVTGATLYAADGAAGSPVRDALLRFASEQHGDGAIKPTVGTPGEVLLIDYTAYWIEDVYDYVLYSGDVATGRRLLPNVVRALDGWYPAQMVGTLFSNRLGWADYAFIDRRDPFVAYYNAEYVRALDLAAALADWVGDGAHAKRWAERAASLRPAIHDAFWDAAAGAFKDTVGGPIVHPQDGNAFAVLAGIADHGEAVSALTYLSDHNRYPYGNSIADNDAWDGYPWGFQAKRRVYPFMSYFALLARFETGLDDTAVDLIRHEWGYMLANGPGTMWETIGPFGGGPVHGSWAHGWSTGAAPALTAYVLGVRPTSPGFSTFAVLPHTSALAWASGTVPTPHGDLKVAWHRLGDKLVVSVDAPTGTRWENAPAAAVAKPAPVIRKTAAQPRAKTKPPLE